MLLGMLFLFYSTITFVVASDNNKIESPRSSRHIYFNSVSDDIEVSLDLSIPFLKIPLKGNFHPDLNLGIPKINLAPKALAFGGAIVILTSFLASVFSKGVPSQSHRYGRREDSFVTDTFLNTVNTVISNSHRCPSRLACWVSRSSTKRNLARWKEVTRNKLLASIFNTTAVEEAFRFGSTGGDCESFTPCPLNKDQLSDFMAYFSTYTNSLTSPSVAN